MLALTLRPRRSVVVINAASGKVKIKATEVLVEAVEFLLTLPLSCQILIGGKDFRTPDGRFTLRLRVIRKDEKSDELQSFVIRDDLDIIRVFCRILTDPNEMFCGDLRISIEAPRHIQVYREQLECYYCQTCQVLFFMLGQDVSQRVNVCLCGSCRKVFLHDGRRVEEVREATFAELEEKAGIAGLSRNEIKTILDENRGARGNQFLPKAFWEEIVRFAENARGYDMRPKFAKRANGIEPQESPRL